MFRMIDALSVLARCAGPDGNAHFPDEMAEDDWPELIKLARFHGLTPLIAHRSQTGQVTGVPPQPLKEMTRDLHRNRLFHAAATDRLNGIAEAMQASGIRYIPLKGPRLASEVYPAAGVRPFEDLDILIPSARAGDAFDCLRHLGYRPAGGEASLRFARRRHFHSQWSHPDTGQCVELHWRAVDPYTMPRDEGFDECVGNDPSAYAVYLTLHIAKHGILNRAICEKGLNPFLAAHPSADVRILWLLDFVLFTRHHELTRDALLSTASRWNVQAAVNRTCRLASILDPAQEFHRAPPRAISALTLRGFLLRRMAADLEEPVRMPVTPWWLKPGRRSGFRPVRLLDLIGASR